jgi:hypothetical protein
MSSRLVLAFGALALLSASAFAQAPSPGPAQAVYGSVDHGVYRISVGDRRVASESFVYTIHFDSLYINSEYRQPLRGGDTLVKSQMLVVRHFDNDLLFYNSTMRIPGHADAIRGITVGDTVLNVFRESETGGEGTTFLKPGGRMFAIEANAYALFDLVFRELATRKGWEQRPVNLLTLGGTDTIVVATARSLGTQTVTWGGTKLEARKYSLSDGRVEFYAWIGPRGYMLRLEQPAMGLIVEREPAKPAVKKPAASGAKTGTAKAAAKPASK